ncbi:MAG: LCP family protein [Eubacteriales bacterium]
MNRKKVIKILTATLCVLLALACGSCTWFFVRYNQIRSNPHSVINSNVDTQINTDTGVELPTITYDGKEYYKNPNMVTLLFLGIDGYQERASKNLGYRSDMIMICAIDTKKYKVTLISIPRDTKANITKMNQNGNITGSYVNKINAAFAGYSGKDLAYLNTVQTVENFINCDEQFDIDLSLYAGVDIDGITDIADAVGGVQVNLDMSLSGIGKKGQTVTLKGQDAIDYVRERHGVGGDLKRAYRQQQFMLALAKKIKQLGARKSILALWDKVDGVVKTNLDTDQMLAFATILEDVNLKGIAHVTIPTTGDSSSGKSYQIHDEEALEKIIIDTFYIKKTE